MILFTLGAGNNVAHHGHDGLSRDRIIRAFPYGLKVLEQGAGLTSIVVAPDGDPEAVLTKQLQMLCLAETRIPVILPVDDPLGMLSNQTVSSSHLTILLQELP